MKLLQWAWIVGEEPELFASYRTAINAMSKRIGQEGDSEEDVLMRAHRAGLRLAIVEVTMEVKLVLDAPPKLGPG